MRIPELRTLRDSNPITGEVWVVDENNHVVASFKIKNRESHLKQFTGEESVNAGLNKEMAESLIQELQNGWKAGYFP